MSKKKANAIKLGSVKKSGMRTQFGALCYRIRNEKVQVLIVTSRRTKRWIMPKGWPMDGVTPGDAALQEAWEECGVKGRVKGGIVGFYTYRKEMGEKRRLCMVIMYAVKVKTLKSKYPEATERKRKWVSVKKAAKLLDDKELAQIVKNFDPVPAAVAK